LADERGLHVHFELASDQPRGGQQLDAVAQLGRVPQVHQFQRVDPLPRKRRDRHLRAERKLTQQHQLLRRIGAVDVERRVGFGVSQPLSLNQHVGIRPSLLVHFGQDEIARAVEDRLNRRDLVRGHRLANRRNDRNATRDRRLEGDRAAEFPRAAEDFVAVFAEQRLVGGDNVFARFQQPQHDGARGFQSTNHMQGDVDIPVGVHGVGIVGDHAVRQAHAASLFEVLHDDPPNLDRPAGSTSDPFLLIGQNPRHTGSDGAHSDQSDSQRRGGWHVTPFDS